MFVVSFPHQIFLSYSRKDAEAVLRFRDLLEQTGAGPVWLDLDRINGGAQWRETLAEAIESAKVLILCATRASVASKVVQREALYARRQSVPVFIVRFEDGVALPKALDFEFGNEHYAAWNPADSEIPFPIHRTLAGFGIHSVVYETYEGLGKARHADTIRKIDALPHLMDRDAQKTPYERFVAAGKTVMRQRPWVVLLHGSKEQLLPEFQRVLVEDRLKTVLEEENFPLHGLNVIDPITIPLPQIKARDLDSPVSVLAQRLRLSRAATRDDLARYFSQHPGVCQVATFSLDVDDADFAAFKGFLHRFLGYWEKFPEIGRSPVLIKVAVSSSSRSGPRSKVCRHLADLARQRPFRQGNAWCALPCLDDVRDEEAALWADQQPVRELLELLELGVSGGQAMIRKIYSEHQTDRLPMIRLAPVIRDHLHDRLHKRFN